MNLKLTKATDAQKKAAFDKVYPELVKLAEAYADQVHVPFVNVRAMIDEKLRDPVIIHQMMQVIDDAVDAAEAVGP
jgi:hypothetical protein